jgi:8-oxo-dGTP pyrophosphatase MutT (NUDIX family)
MALSFDPQALPLLGRDDHLPAIEPSVLQPVALRQRFDAPPRWTPELEIGPRLLDRPPAPASVLIPLVLRDELTVLLTQRTDHLNSHPGQISFPGGRAESLDADAVATALREAQEEIGLAAEHVDVLGCLPMYTTGTGFMVTPVVGLVDPRFALLLDPFEVAEVFEVPLSFLMNPANHQRHGIEVAGVQREFFSMPWQPADAAENRKHYFIWGATAAMLRNLYRFLSA